MTKLGTKAPELTKENIDYITDLATKVGPIRALLEQEHFRDCLSEIPQRNEEINEVSDELMGWCRCKTEQESCTYCRLGRKLRKITREINADINGSLGD